MTIHIKNKTGKEKLEKFKDLKVIGEIFSSSEKTKIFLLVYKWTKPSGDDFISGYRLSRSVNLSLNTIYGFLEKMVNYGIFERPSKIKGIKWVRITDYGIYIYEKIKSISPKVSEIL